jgi:hypothetical protein
MAAAMVVLLAVVCFFPDLSRAGDIPADSERLHARLSGRLQPSVRSWINLEANKLRGQPAVDESRLRADILTRFKGQNPGSNDILAIAFLVMMQAAQDADRDLKAIMEETRATNESSRKPREKTAQQKSTLSPARQGSSAMEKGGPAANEMSEMISMRLQMTMDRRSKFISTLSNIMKKISTTQDTLVQNLK